MHSTRFTKNFARALQSRCYSSATSPFAPRHLLSIADLSPQELTQLIRNAASHKSAIKSGTIPKQLAGGLSGKTVSLMFNKRSTRTRISTEGAVVIMGGHPMFLGKDDIQLGVCVSFHHIQFKAINWLANGGHNLTVN